MNGSGVLPGWLQSLDVSLTFSGTAEHWFSLSSSSLIENTFVSYTITPDHSCSPSIPPSSPTLHQPPLSTRLTPPPLFSTYFFFLHCRNVCVVLFIHRFVFFFCCFLQFCCFHIPAAFSPPSSQPCLHPLAHAYSLVSLQKRAGVPWISTSHGISSCRETTHLFSC